MLSGEMADYLDKVFKEKIEEYCGKKSLFSEKIEKDFDLKGRVIRYNIEDDANQLGG